MKDEIFLTRQQLEELTQEAYMRGFRDAARVLMEVAESREKTSEERPS